MLLVISEIYHFTLRYTIKCSELNCVPFPQRYVQLLIQVSVNVTLFIKRVFTDIILIK